MVSAPHEAMHRIFQEHPDLFSRVSEVLGIDFAPPTSVTVLSCDLTETRPLERRVDTLLRLESEDQEPLLLAVEAQGSKNPDKPASWAYYASYLLAKYRVQPLLLVVCQDRATAEWASQPVTFGPPQWPLLTLRPLVAGPHNMPVITDPAEARKDLALATLSAITHVANRDIGAILKAVTTVLRDTPHPLADPIIELIAQGMGTSPAAELWRNLVAVDLSFYKSPLSQELREAGREAGREEGREEGRAERAAQDILKVLAKRGIEVPEGVQDRITHCDDLETLDRWLLEAVVAPTAEAIFTDDEV
ncbi:hypothetical protein [Streptomyces broussonetiae]|uniref:DUF4351 domain-containing protein n=1 Tax=Streptomyces broussonetiae TaxID=2686304 RepID=A0ABV5E5W4_9ACTN